jgi:hypothetical protein
MILCREVNRAELEGEDRCCQLKDTMGELPDMSEIYGLFKDELLGFTEFYGLFPARKSTARGGHAPAKPLILS